MAAVVVVVSSVFLSSELPQATPTNATTAYDYDSANLLTLVTDPDNNHAVFHRDGNGQVTSTDAPTLYATTQKYDGAGRLTQVVTPDNTTVNYSSNAQFTVTVSGTGPFKYQWLSNDVPLTDNSKFPGNQTATLTVAGATCLDAAGGYAVLVTINL